MTTVVLLGLVIAFVGVCGLWQGTSGAAVLLESTDRWPLAGSYHREVIPVADHRFIVRDLSGFDDLLFGYSDLLEDAEGVAADEGRRQPVTGGWFPRGKRSIHDVPIMTAPSTEDAIVLIVGEGGGRRRYGNWLSTALEPIRRAIPPHGFSAARGKKAMDIEGHQ